MSDEPLDPLDQMLCEIAKTPGAVKFEKNMIKISADPAKLKVVHSAMVQKLEGKPQLIKNVQPVNPKFIDNVRAIYVEASVFDHLKLKNFRLPEKSQPASVAPTVTNQESSVEPPQMRNGISIKELTPEEAHTRLQEIFARLLSFGSITREVDVFEANKNMIHMTTETPQQLDTILSLGRITSPKIDFWTTSSRKIAAFENQMKFFLTDAEISSLASPDRRRS